jgi:nucleotide-binding universal stress UspA family protein
MQKEIRNILVPIDFTETSDNALQTAIAMCKRHGAKLHLLQVAETELLVSMAGMQVPATDMATEMKLSREDGLRQMASSIAGEHGIECCQYSESGFMPYIVCTKAEKLDCDLIVAGTAGKNRNNARGNGNVMAILRNSSVPVLTVPSGRRSLQFSKILFPVRPVINALSKYKAVMPIIKKNKASVLVMGLLKQDQGGQVGTVKQMVDDTSAYMVQEKVAVDRKLYFGKNIAEEVLNTGSKRDIDLVVITGTLKRGLKQFFVPGYVQRIINNSLVPVLSIKPRAHMDEYALKVAMGGHQLV